MKRRSKQCHYRKSCNTGNAENVQKGCRNDKSSIGTFTLSYFESNGEPCGNITAILLSTSSLGLPLCNAAGYLSPALLTYLFVRGRVGERGEGV